MKVYNLCDDSFIDLNQLQFIDGKVNIAYFPMADHNPGSVKLLFEMILDMLLFMS